MDAGGVKALMGMLETASDDDTRREALTTLATLAPYCACSFIFSIVVNALFIFETFNKHVDVLS